MTEENVAKTVYVCTNKRFSVSSPSCGMRGSEKTLTLLQDAMKARGFSYPIEKSICFGQCTFGPAIRIAPGGEFFMGAKPAKLDEIVDWLVTQMTEED